MVASQQPRALIIPSATPHFCVLEDALQSLLSWLVGVWIKHEGVQSFQPSARYSSSCSLRGQVAQRRAETLEHHLFDACVLNLWHHSSLPLAVPVHPTCPNALLQSYESNFKPCPWMTIVHRWGPFRAAQSMMLPDLCCRCGTAPVCYLDGPKGLSHPATSDYANPPRKCNVKCQT